MPTRNRTAKKKAAAASAAAPSPEQTGQPATAGGQQEKTGGQLILERGANSGVPLSEADKIIRSMGAKRQE